MKYIVFLMMLSLFTLNVNAEFKGEGVQTQSVYYPQEGEPQVLMGIHIQSVDFGGHPTQIVFEFSPKTPISQLSNFKLWSSDNAPYFAKSVAKEITLSGKFSKNGKQLIYKCSEGVASHQVAGSYVWVTAEISPKIARNAEIDISVKHFSLNGMNVKLTHGSPKGKGKVYPNPYRVITYYRSRWLFAENGVDKGWGNWSDEYMQVATDIILFQVGCDAEGNLTGTEDKMLLSSINKLKQARKNQKSSAKIILGMAHCASGMNATSSNAQKTDRLIQQIVAFLDKHQLDGIDIDWEYPDNHSQWNNFTTFMAKLKIGLFAKGYTVSAAVSAFYKSPTPAFMQVVDYVNFMTYDAQREHSTFELFKSDIQWARNQGLMNSKIVGGLPFYGMILEGKTSQGVSRWDTQRGYAYVLSQFPKIASSENYYQDPQHGRAYFNGQDMIRQKCKYAKKQKIGGVMVWTFDNDAPYANSKALVHPLRQELPLYKSKK